MKVTLLELLCTARRKFLKAQRFDRYLNSKFFEMVYEQATEAQASDIVELIKSGDLDTLKGYCRDICNRALIERPIMELRNLGRLLKIKYYAVLDKKTLVQELEKCYGTEKPPGEQETGNSASE